MPLMRDKRKPAGALCARWRQGDGGVFVRFCVAFVSLFLIHLASSCSDRIAHRRIGTSKAVPE